MKPIDVDSQILSTDIFWMLGVVALMIPIIYFGKKIGRAKGALLLGTYIAYIAVTIISLKG